MKYIAIAIIITMFSCTREGGSSISTSKFIIHELNEKEILKGDKIIALVGATLIDGNGGEPIPNSAVVIRNDKIEWVGKAEALDIPKEAEIVDVKGLTLLPGLIDAHYHNLYSQEIPSLYLNRGITSVRDPGAWNDFYDSVRATGKPIPRLFLTGPHIDAYPPAWPDNSYLVNDPEEGRLAVHCFAGQGATAIKVYFRLPIATIREICTTAHQYGLPVTGHLEITNAKDAINAGLDGIEHVTSFGTCLLPLRKVEKYKQLILANNGARERERYVAWNSFKLENNAVADSLIQFLSDKKTYVTPTLASFEKQADIGDSVERLATLP